MKQDFNLLCHLFPQGGSRLLEEKQCISKEFPQLKKLPSLWTNGYLKAYAHRLR